MDQVLNLVAKNIKKATEKQAVLQVASEQLQGDIEYRIWTDYKATDGGDIGSYSTNPMYASLSWNSSFVRSIGAGSGKNSKKATFKNGKPRKSKYYAGGYKEYKGDVKGVTKVNLELTGQLKKDFGWELLKGYAVIGFKSVGSQQISVYLEEHFGKAIFQANKKEIQETVNEAEKFVKSRLK